MSREAGTADVVRSKVLILAMDFPLVEVSLAGPPLHSEEGSGVMPICDLF